jgi:Dolichyl-phosphate-mannose-protein mannosyltransferase
MDSGIATDRPSRALASGRLLDAACLLLLLAGFAYVGFRDLRQPGVYEDEAFAATPAIKLVNGDLETGATQLTALGRAWPIMRSSYFGPVKIYILAAAFSIFGIRIEVLRATTALLGFTGVALLFGILRRELGRLPAFMSAMLLATDLDYVLATRCDWGPVAFSIFAGLAALGALLAWARRPESRLAPALAGLMMGLGLSHKLDFAACALAVTAVFWLLYRSRLRGRRAGALLAAAFFLFGAAPALLYGVLTRGEPLRVGRALAASRGNQTFPPAP